MQTSLTTQLDELKDFGERRKTQKMHQSEDSKTKRINYCSQYHSEQKNKQNYND